MATRSATRAAINGLTMRKADIGELADKLFMAKRRVYRRTLLNLLKSLGYQDAKRPRLAAAVEDALIAEAKDHAQRIATTYNDSLEREAKSLPESLSDDDVKPRLEKWARVRQRNRARSTAITEAYGPHSDALVAAMKDLGVEALFDFGGHPELGDLDPACDICVALVATNPHTLDEMVRVGTPHPGCAQDWRLSSWDRRELPADPIVGQAIGGIVGGEPLITRAGGREEAARFVLDLRNG